VVLYHCCSADQILCVVHALCIHASACCAHDIAFADSYLDVISTDSTSLLHPVVVTTTATAATATAAITATAVVYGLALYWAVYRCSSIYCMISLGL
jgi:hypothetical protein